MYTHILISPYIITLDHLNARFISLLECSPTRDPLLCFYRNVNDLYLSRRSEKKKEQKKYNWYKSSAELWKSKKYTQEIVEAYSKKN